jgi:hypothetical protein
MSESATPVLDQMERTSMVLLIDMQSALAHALKSLDGKTFPGPQELFLAHMSAYIRRTASAYIVLRKAGELEASRLLIRPTMEALFEIMAVQKDPSMLYRIFHHDHEQVSKLARPASGVDFDVIHEKKWQDFKRGYASKFPHHVQNESRLRIEDLARSAGMNEYYDLHYRLYCRYTHPALEAVMGGEFDRFAPKPGEDNETMIVSTVCAMQATQKLGGDVPNAKDFLGRISDLWPGELLF